jgi:hypothetical protein
VKSAQFFKGKIDGYEQSFETINLIEMLPIDKLSDLMDYTIINKPCQRYFKTERVLALVESYKVENGDASGRGGIQTRGILYKFERTAKLDNLDYLFPEEQFVNLLYTGKRLKMPPAPTLKKPLDQPPPMEWEV